VPSHYGLAREYSDFGEINDSVGKGLAMVLGYAGCKCWFARNSSIISIEGLETKKQKKQLCQKNPGPKLTKTVHTQHWHPVNNGKALAKGGFYLAGVQSFTQSDSQGHFEDNSILMHFVLLNYTKCVHERGVTQTFTTVWRYSIIISLALVEWSWANVNAKMKFSSRLVVVN